MLGYLASLATTHSELASQYLVERATNPTETCRFKSHRLLSLQVPLSLFFSLPPSSRLFRYATCPLHMLLIRSLNESDARAQGVPVTSVVTVMQTK